MKFILTSFFLLFLAISSGYGQTEPLPLIPKQQKIEALKAWELRNGSTEIENTATYISDSFYELASPIIIQRSVGNFDPKPRLWYFYSTPDSTVRELNYRWYEAIYKPTDSIPARDKSRIPKYKVLFEELTQRVSKELGMQPTEIIPEKEVDQNVRKYWETVNKWERKGFAAELTYFYAIQGGNVSELFVTLKINWDDKEEQQKAREKVLQQRDSVAFLFLKNAAAKKFDKCWDMLDEDLQNYIPQDKFYEYLKELGGIYKKKEAFERLVSGKETNANFKIVNMSIYKRKSDKVPPKFMVKFTFKDDTALKIYGVKHMGE